METRTGDWRDLLSAYKLALDSKKIAAGLVAVLMTLLILVVATYVDDGLIARDWTPVPGRVSEAALRGESTEVRLQWGQAAGLVLSAKAGALQHPLMGRICALMNPFRGGVLHFILSAVGYVALFWVWSGFGGAISRAAVLEYVRDERPTSKEVWQAVRAKRMAYFLAPVTPLIAIVLLTVANALGGLVASIPLVGPILLIVPGAPLLLISTMLIVFLIVVGALAFGMMMPAVSAGGKGAVEGWSTAYSYVLWAFGRFVVYTLIAGAIGVIAVLAASAVVAFFNYALHQTVNLGYLRSFSWVLYGASGAGKSVGGYYGVLQIIMTVVLLLVAMLPLAFAFSYYFTANTIVFFLLRKHVDNVDVDELFDEDELEEPTAEPGAEAAADEEKPAEAQPADQAEPAPADEQQEAPEPAEAEDKQTEEQEEGEAE